MSAVSPAPEKTVRRGDYRPPDYLIDRAELCFDLDADETLVRASLALRRNPEVISTEALLRLDGEDLDLREIMLDGTPLAASAYYHDRFGLTLTAPPPAFTLSTKVVIHPRRNTSLMGLYSAGGILCTQCEPEAFRRITFFLDRPDVLTVFRTRLRADAGQYPVLLANGNPVSALRLDDGRHCVEWIDPIPKPAYLFALVAGKLHRESDRFITRSGRGVELNVYVEPANAGRCNHALASLKNAMAWDETRYGREYDLEVYNLVAVSSYTMSAMENKGLNLFNDRYLLADADTACDADYRDIEALVAHEYFHNWSGNRVTCRDWFQLALKEGFTVLREQQFMADTGWGAQRRLADAALMRGRQFAEDAGPMAHAVRPDAYVEIDNFYTDTVYSKGAEILRMIATWVGREAFDAGATLYFECFDAQAATLEDFLNCMAQASGRDLSGFLRWFERAGTPLLTVRDDYDAATGIYRVIITQSGSDDQAPLPIPLALGLLGRDGRSLPVGDTFEPDCADSSRLLEIAEPQVEFCFHGLPEKPVPALLRDFSAPVRIDYPYNEDDLALLARHEPDAYVRWDAFQRLFSAALGRTLVDARHEPVSLIKAIGAVLADQPQSAEPAPGLAAQWLRLPDTVALLPVFAGEDIAAVDNARRQVETAIAARLGGLLEKLYHACDDPRAYCFNPEQAGLRALKNVCLGYLVAGGRDLPEPHGLALCLAQYQHANNMTDRLAALQLLAHSGHPKREAVLDDFRQRWQNHPQVMDNWLAVQARSRRADTLAQIRRLMQHPVFNLDRPNPVRSLIETFCRDNPLAFHAADGSGYGFLAEIVRDIDADNPQLAAGLLRYLADWRALDPARQARMQAALAQLQALPSLSRGCREIAETALDQVASAAS